MQTIPRPPRLITDVANAPSTAFVHGGKLYILTGTEYLVYDGSTIAGGIKRGVCADHGYLRAPCLAVVRHTKR